jgi:hypothetical protein
VISVITPAWRNWEQLRRAIASLEAQSFTDWQHVVVSDGPDPELRGHLHHLGYAGHGQRVLAELGRNWHGFLGGDGAGQPPGTPGQRGARGSRGVSPARVGTYLAAGDHIAYLDSDCEYLPHHLEVHAEALAASGADFTFSQMNRYLDGIIWDTVGDGEPAHGHIDGNMAVHKTALLKVANWRWGGDADWDLISSWAAGHARHEFIPQVTVHWHHASADL